MNSEKIKVGIAGRWNPRDKNAWSGIYYSTCAEIEKYFDTEFFFYKWPWHVRERLILHKQFQKLIRKRPPLNSCGAMESISANNWKKNFAERR